MAAGTISFQANDKTDVFHVAQVVEHGIEASDEAIFSIEDSQFESDKAWVTGNVPRMSEVCIAGDTSVISAWFKSEAFDRPFVIRVYVECEFVEELEEVKADVKALRGQDDCADILESHEIHL